MWVAGSCLGVQSICPRLVPHVRLFSTEKESRSQSIPVIPFWPKIFAPPYLPNPSPHTKTPFIPNMQHLQLRPPPFLLLFHRTTPSHPKSLFGRPIFSYSPPSPQSSLLSFFTQIKSNPPLISFPTVHLYSHHPPPSATAFSSVQIPVSAHPPLPLCVIVSSVSFFQNLCHLLTPSALFVLQARNIQPNTMVRTSSITSSCLRRPEHPIARPSHVFSAVKIHILSMHLSACYPLIWSLFSCDNGQCIKHIILMRLAHLPCLIAPVFTFACVRGLDYHVHVPPVQSLSAFSCNIGQCNKHITRMRLSLFAMHHLLIGIC